MLQLIRLAYRENDLAAGMLYLTLYSFMLRVPSEALPVVASEDPWVQLDPGTLSCLAVADNEIVRRLAKRKNKLNGTTIRRACCCDKNCSMCPFMR